MSVANTVISTTTERWSLFGAYYAYMAVSPSTSSRHQVGYTKSTSNLRMMATMPYQGNSDVVNRFEQCVLQQV